MSTCNPCGREECAFCSEAEDLESQLADSRKLNEELEYKVSFQKSDIELRARMMNKQTHHIENLQNEWVGMRKDLEWAMKELFSTFNEFDGPDYRAGLTKVQAIRQKYNLGGDNVDSQKTRI